MTKAEFDYGYRDGRLAVHMPDKPSADFLLQYVNKLCGTHYRIDWSITQFPYLFRYHGGDQAGWTGTGAYNDHYTKITYDEFFAAINDLQEIVDVDFEDMTEIL